MRKSISLFVMLVAVAAYAGAPLKGIDVKLGKNPGGSPAARAASTDAGGHFDFGPMPKGSYAVKFTRDQLKGNNRTAIVDINGVKHEWDFERAQGRVMPGSTSKTMAHDSWSSALIVESDGKTPIRGTVTLP